MTLLQIFIAFVLVCCFLGWLALMVWFTHKHLQLLSDENEFLQESRGMVSTDLPF